MNIEDLSSHLRANFHDHLARLSELLKLVPDDVVVEADTHSRDYEEDTGKDSLAVTLRKRMYRRLHEFYWLLMHVPDDEFILAHTPSPDYNPNVRMSAEFMQKLAARAENHKQFFELCDEAVREADRRVANRGNNANPPPHPETEVCDDRMAPPPDQNQAAA